MCAQELTLALSEVKLLPASGHNSSEPSSAPLYSHADPWTLSLQPTLIRGLHYQYLSQFFFPLLLFFEQLLQQVAKCLALLCDHSLQQKDSSIHGSVPYSCKHSPCPNFQQSTYHTQKSQQMWKPCAPWALGLAEKPA